MLSNGYAIKRLTHSDLSLFESYFRSNSASKQKAINMNAAVLVGVLYPALQEQPVGTRHGVRLRIVGPGLRPPHDVQRKLIKEAKNWRLNGELIPPPIGDPDRYASLAPGDLAIFHFEGASAPEGIVVTLLSQAGDDDAAALAALDALVPSGRGGMLLLDRGSLQAAVDTVAPDLPPDHPLLDAALSETAVELLAAGASDDIVRRTGVRRSQRRLSQETLDDLRCAQMRNGRLGEELVRKHLGIPDDPDCEHVSADNAVAPYDFRRGAERIEVKATSLAHATPFHISMNEVEEAATERDGPYAIWRISAVNADVPRLRVLPDFAPAARNLLDTLAGLPAGIRPDGFSILPDEIDGGWEEVELIDRDSANEL